MLSPAIPFFIPCFLFPIARDLHIPNAERIESSIAKAEAHARALQDLIFLSGGNPRLAYKKALLVRLELQYSLALLKLDHNLEAPPQGPYGRTIDLERALVRLSSHICEALRLYREKDYAGCLSELYAADALIAKIIPRLQRENKS